MTLSWKERDHSAGLRASAATAAPVKGRPGPRRVAAAAVPGVPGAGTRAFCRRGAALQGVPPRWPSKAAVTNYGMLLLATCGPAPTGCVGSQDHGLVRDSAHPAGLGPPYLSGLPSATSLPAPLKDTSPRRRLWLERTSRKDRLGLTSSHHQGFELLCHPHHGDAPSRRVLERLLISAATQLPASPGPSTPSTVTHGTHAPLPKAKLSTASLQIPSSSHWSRTLPSPKGRPPGLPSPSLASMGLGAAGANRSSPCTPFRLL